MIDFEKIGVRIAEERKLVKHISQRKMAEDLNMYQADISNLEKAKNGSGITDLYKLDYIADYLNVSVESLIFGKKDDSMLKYYGNTMKLQPSESYVNEKHEAVLKGLIQKGFFLLVQEGHCKQRRRSRLIPDLFSRLFEDITLLYVSGITQLNVIFGFRRATLEVFFNSRNVSFGLLFQEP